VHTALFWLVMITGYLSAFWVMVANGFLQEPVGHVVENGVARIHDLGAVLTNPHTIGALWHIAPAALLTAAVVMLGISSWHLLRSTGELDFFRRSVRVAVITGSVAAPATVALGGAQFSYLTEGKLLALGGSAAERASHQADMAARYGPGDWTPPTWISFAGPVMIVIGVVLSLVFFALIVFLPWNAFDRARPVWLRRFWHRVYVWMIPLPFLAVASGWLVREVGRQPWLVTGELTVEAAVAPNSAGQVLFSLVAFGSVFVSLALIDWWLIARLARRGPTRMMLGTDVAGSDIVGSDSDLADAEHGDRPAGRLLSATAQVKGG
jgi:cytochrome d ubiquinol oxidase subunit I